MSLFDDLLKDRHSSRHEHHDDYGYYDHPRGRRRHAGALYYASALKPYAFKLLRNKTVLIAAGVILLLLLLAAVALIAVLAPLAMKLLTQIEKNGITGLLDMINKNGIKELLDFVSQILGLFGEGGGKK